MNRFRPRRVWRRLLPCLILLALASAASLALGLVLAHWLGGGGGQAVARGPTGYCVATLDHNGSLTSIDCRLWLRLSTATVLQEVRVAGAALWLREPLVARRGSLSFSLLRLGPGALYAVARFTGLAGGTARSLVEVAAASGSIRLPGKGVLVAEASGETPLLVQRLNLSSSWGYVVAETGGLCSPVIEAYSGLVPVARWSLVVETRGSAAPISVAALVPGNATGVRLTCIGDGSVPASIQVYRAPLLRITLLDPHGNPVLDEEVPVLVRQVGVEALPPPWS